jgi:hypothetical protein
MSISTFSIRDLLWAILVISIVAGWYVHHRDMNAARIKVTKENERLRHSVARLKEVLVRTWPKAYGETIPPPNWKYDEATPSN